MNILRFKAFDESGAVEITYFNQNYLRDTFVTGATFRFWGKVYRDRGTLKMTSPIFEPYVEGIALRDLVPVYPVTSGISQKFISGIISEAFSECSDGIPELFDASFLESNKIVSAGEALKFIHFPTCASDIERGRLRISFEEAYIVAAAFATERAKKVGSAAPAMTHGDIGEYTAALPYELTGAQKRSLDEICADMAGCEPMRRILIGDVGSGKTAVAAGAAYVAAKSGYQCAIMAPTEILAKQHYEELRRIFSRMGINTELLCGSTPASEKRRILSVLSGETRDLSGKIDVIIGTHALISDGVSFEKLGLVITDEQHRFGVMQRASLASKSSGVHMLAMSATPIPRTLSLVYYGDLDVSKLDEMPPGRQRVDTFVVDERYRERVIRFIRTHVRAGNRVYIVCPMIEESQVKASAEFEKKIENDPEEMANLILFEEEKAPLKSTVSYARELALRLPDVSIGLLNGKMKTAQKNAVMEDFLNGKVQVLVSTTVIEVGVNVPEATLMIVENAERFGLSQLHQLRGRVGRGERKSFCILISDSKNEKSRERLSVMKKTSDGGEIAEADLKLRGAGDLFAPSGRFRQHGAASSFVFCENGEITERAVLAARETVERDPELSLYENAALKRRVESLRANIENTIS